MQSTSVALSRRERFVFAAWCALFACAWPLVTVKRNESVVHWCTCTYLPPGHRRHYRQYWTFRWHKSHRHRSVPCLPVLTYWINWKEAMEMVPPRLPTSRQVEVPMPVADGGVACPRACRPCVLISTTMIRHCAFAESLMQRRQHHFRRPRRCRRPPWPALVVCFSSLLEE